MRDMRFLLPKARAGQVIGLLGGSFDPPHAGHVHISEQALRRFGLDRIWWLVSPGNPLKKRGPAPMSRRAEAARRLIRNPRIEVTDFEAQVGTRYTAETILALYHHYPRTRFVWLMGADNLAQFHLWDSWEWIMQNIPIGVIARPGDRMGARTSPAAQRFERFRIPGKSSRLLGHAAAPAWCFINVPMMKLSSTQIRARGEWPR